MDHPLNQYHYDLPDKLIGREPANPRDSARLFVYDTRNDIVTFDTFKNLAKHLPSPALMILNDTGVIPARVEFTKDTGGKVEGLVLVNEGTDADGNIAVIATKQLIVGRTISITEHSFTVMRQDGQKFFLKPDFEISLLPSILEKYGTTPTPPYLGTLAMSEHDVRERYQTVFAQEQKSVAAPTASLHFTETVFRSLEEKGIETAHVTLDVGLGTFATVKAENIEGKFLHTEHLKISRSSFETIQNAKHSQVPVIAVGTTATRTLESQVAKLLNEKPETISTSTNIFIMPGYDFKIVDHLITNFHVSESSLMALVDAFLQHKKAKKNILDLYAIAIEQKFKFYSFGDSMLIL